jgi:hypothetical protein
MGQKTNPVGLRLGTYRKWASSWYNKENHFFINKQESFISKGIINSRGGNYTNAIEEFIIKIIKRKTSTNFKKRFKFMPIDFYRYKGFGGYTYGFFLYTKIISSSKK